jgi:tight adherence protein B
MPGRSARAPDLDPVANVVHRLAVLLAAGVTPASSWQYLAELPGPCAPVVRVVASAARDGEDVPRSVLGCLDGRPAADANAWRGLAAAWAVATDAGAPLASTLHDLAGSLRDLARVERELRVALAGPVATARMVMVLPVVGVLFGLALGFDTVGILFTTIPGGACLVVGLALLLGARFWNSRLIRSARPPNSTPGITFDLVAIAVSGGASIPRALDTVERVLVQSGLKDGDGRAGLDEVLTLSRRAGVPAAGLLRSEADGVRRTATSEGDQRASRLAVTLMIPLGVCVLPAFMLLGVAPLLISVVSSTVSGL